MKLCCLTFIFLNNQNTRELKINPGEWVDFILLLYFVCKLLTSVQ